MSQGVTHLSSGSATTSAPENTTDPSATSTHGAPKKIPQASPTGRPPPNLLGRVLRTKLPFVGNIVRNSPGGKILKALPRGVVDGICDIAMHSGFLLPGLADVTIEPIAAGIKLANKAAHGEEITVHDAIIFGKQFIPFDDFVPDPILSGVLNHFAGAESVENNGGKGVSVKKDGKTTTFSSDQIGELLAKLGAGLGLTPQRPSTQTTT